MSFYENQAWSNPPRQQGWEQPPPPSRSGTSSAVPTEDPTAFGSQVEEVERAIDNLFKSGKLFGMPGRRDSLPMMGGPRPFPEYDPRMGGAMPRHQSLSDFDPMRPHSAANLQGFYANQRFQGRGSEPEGMAQAKRRMAAQRERELRNYHQEQQINRTYNAERGIAGSTRAEGTSSPGGLGEEERRNLIAQQRNALYAGERVPGTADSHTPRPLAGAHNAPTSTAGAARGASPRAFDPFHMGQPQSQGTPLDQSGQAASQQTGTGPSPNIPQQRSRANSTSSPSSNPNSFSLFDNAAQQSSRTSNSSPGGSSPTAKAPQSATSGVAPIGTRPAPASQGQAPNPALNKRSTTPLPSPLAYGFTSNEDGERSTSASSNPPGTNNQDVNVGLGWGSKSGVWGSNKPLGVQASVWG